uniref:Uncharacterized protein n=1 Tax=Cacopsylla melanoneura TaxID=428564 RepID=A0A8D8W600_9HEMI
MRAANPTTAPMMRPPKSIRVGLYKLEPLLEYPSMPPPLYEELPWLNPNRACCVRSSTACTCFPDPSWGVTLDSSSSSESWWKYCTGFGRMPLDGISTSGYLGIAA